MNKCVGVRFHPNGKIYYYMIPDYIDSQDIDKYVIVENAYYNSYNDVSPYKIAQVVYVEDDLQWCDRYHATKYIVDTINGKNYKKILDKQRAEKKAEEILDNIWDQYPLENKLKLLGNARPVIKGEANMWSEARDLCETAL